MSDEVFEFQYRWADMAARGLLSSLGELEARDQALEQFIKDFPCSGTVPTFDLGIQSATRFAAVMTALGETIYTVTWITDVDFTPQNLRYTIDVLNNPITAQFGTYDSGFPGTITPVEGVSLTLPGPGSGNVDYSGSTIIPSGSEVGFKMTNTVAGFNLINTLQVIVDGQASAATLAPALTWAT